MVTGARAGGRPRRLRGPERQDPCEDDPGRPREGSGLRRYVHVGTGTTTPTTARAYEDFGLFTADEESRLMSPTSTTTPHRFAARSASATFSSHRSHCDTCSRGDPPRRQAATAGKQARIRIKTNATSRTKPAHRRAVRRVAAGAEIDIVSRSICALHPGLKGLSENIRVRSIARTVPPAQPCRRSSSAGDKLDF